MLAALAARMEELGGIEPTEPKPKPPLATADDAPPDSPWGDLWLPNEVTLWPENVRAWHVWLAVQDQWEQGFDGPARLPYESVRAVMSDMGIKRRERDEIRPLIQAAAARIGVLRARDSAARDKPKPGTPRKPAARPAVRRRSR